MKKNKKDLVEVVAKKCSADEKITKEIIDELFNEITECLVNGEVVSIHGFGKFMARPYGVRKCYNPITGEMMELKPSIAPAFNAGGKLRERLNSK